MLSLGVLALAWAAAATANQAAGAGAVWLLELNDGLPPCLP